MKADAVFKTRTIVIMISAKQFASKLNQCLDDSEAPANIRERSAVISKLLDIPKHQAWALLEGHQVPDKNLLEQIANEFEVDVEWLSGEK